MSSWGKIKGSPSGGWVWHIDDNATHGFAFACGGHQHIRFHGINIVHAFLLLTLFILTRIRSDFNHLRFNLPITLKLAVLLPINSNTLI